MSVVHRIAGANPAAITRPAHSSPRSARDAGIWSRITLIPRNLAIALLSVYRAVISPLYGNVCRFYPSCSRYALTAIQEHGVVRGIWLGTKRIARCHPWARGGIDDVPAAMSGHAVVARGGFVLAMEPHDACDHSDGVRAEERMRHTHV